MFCFQKSNNQFVCAVRLFFTLGWVLCLAGFFGKESSAQNSMSMVQTFESDFLIQSAPLEFLPGWSANEVRASSSRIFQAFGLGVAGSDALAVQPISTFEGVVTVRLRLDELQGDEIRFFARSLRNGSGDRPAQVFFAWSRDLDFGDLSPLGGENEFANEDQSFREYRLPVPAEYLGQAIFFRFVVRSGPGSGAAARWFLDNFAYGIFEEDTLPPTVVLARGYDAMEIQLQFSESLDPVFSQFPMNYRLDGLEAGEAVLESDSLVRLIFTPALQEGRDYSLQLRQIPDLAGNFLSDTTLQFRFFDPTNIPRKGLVINEIMPAPRPDLDLPNGEYVELFHTGEKDYRLADVRWSAGDRETILPEFWMSPGEFVLLVPESQADFWKDFGEVIPVEGWPTLLNSGASLRLQMDSVLLDQIGYTSASWGSSDLASSGYSLELANPFLICDQSTRWRASVSDQRGTPGAGNSVLDLSPDEQGPQLVRYRFVNELTLELTFDEPLAEQVSVASLAIAGVPAPIGEEFLGSQVRWIFREAFVVNQRYVVEELEVFDCAGNRFSGSFPFEVILPKAASQEDVKINEVLYDPLTGDPKFVELANVSTDYLELGDWFLANRDDLGEPDDVELLSAEGLVLPPLAYLAITTDTIKLKTRYPGFEGRFHQVRRLPSYPIGGGTVLLLDAGLQEAEFFDYANELHHPLLRDAKGVSLERVSLRVSATELQNWQSASELSGFATPGRENSQISGMEPNLELVKIDPEVFDPEGSNGQTFTQISYTLAETGWVGSFRIYDLSGRLIQSLAENAILGNEGLFTWTGTDSQGKRVKMGYYILLVELFDLSGRTRVLKKTVVVAERL